MGGAARGLGPSAAAHRLHRPLTGCGPRRPCRRRRRGRGGRTRRSPRRWSGGAFWPSGGSGGTAERRWGGGGGGGAGSPRPGPGIASGPGPAWLLFPPAGPVPAPQAAGGGPAGRRGDGGGGGRWVARPGGDTRGHAAPSQSRCRPSPPQAWRALSRAVRWGWGEAASCACPSCAAVIKCLKYIKYCMVVANIACKSLWHCTCTEQRNGEYGAVIHTSLGVAHKIRKCYFAKPYKENHRLGILPKQIKHKYLCFSLLEGGETLKV